MHIRSRDTQARAFLFSHMSKACNSCLKTTKKVRQRVCNALRRPDCPLPPSRCVDTQGPWSSTQLWMNMSPHRPTGRKPSNTPSLIYTMSSQLPTQQQIPIHHPLRGSSILMLLAKMRTCVGVGGWGCYTGSIPHPVCVDRRESCCCC